MVKTIESNRSGPRDERKARTRADLLETARRVFELRGFHAASLEEIADAAGYSKGAIYSNFSGKDELFLAVISDHVKRRFRHSRCCGWGLPNT